MTCTDYTRISQGLSIYKQARSPPGLLKSISEIENTSLFQQKKSQKLLQEKVAEELFLEMKGNKEINVSKLTEI